jgi:D-glycero-alpha-D-manno-heptose-7-phosphate kinase
MGSASEAGSFIVTRTPLRLSLAGGGTDLPAYYENGYGCVVSTAIDKFLYVTLKHHNSIFGENYRLNYSITEHVNRLDDIENDIARECLRLIPVEPPIYIGTTADLPAMSGLGSSSSFAVGLLHALHAHRGERVSAFQLAEEAAHVEINMLQRPVGKQDHYAAAFGGFNYIKFLPDNRVVIEPLSIQNQVTELLFSNMAIFWTGIYRTAHSVLEEQKEKTHQNLELLDTIRNLADQLRDRIQQGCEPAEIGDFLNNNWIFKRQLTRNISTTQIDNWYEIAMKAGALGGKLCGAGGGGFLLFIVDRSRRKQVVDALKELTPVAVGYAAQGSQIIIDRENQ